MGTGKLDCVCEYFDTFKDQIKLQKKLENEMIKKHGRNKFTMSIFDNCIIAEFRSVNKFF